MVAGFVEPKPEVLVAAEHLNLVRVGEMTAVPRQQKVDVVTRCGRDVRGDERRAAVLEAEAAVLATDAAIPMLHERVIQGDAARVEDSAKDPRERILVTAQTRLN